MKLREQDQLKLDQVDDRLAKVVRRAAEITKQPFIVLEGLRTISRQQYLLKIGATRTLDSNHLIGHAVDIGPLVEGKISWDWQHYWALAHAMDQAADTLGIALTWGAAWNGTTEDWEDAKQAVEQYKRIRRAQGRSVFLDGPHWELPK
jgi:hypothetical protein